MAPKRRKSTANRKPKGRKPKATTRYFVSATFKMQKTVTSKTDATKWLAKVKKAGGTGTMKKV
jgi:hypothetical protein